MKKQLLLIVAILISNFSIATNHTINTQGMTFVPSSLAINSGDSVTFVNTGGSHNVNGTTTTFPGNPAGFSNPTGVSTGWTYVHVFTLPGFYEYQCDPHIPGMAGSITVSSSSSVGFTSVTPTDPLCSQSVDGGVAVNISQSTPPTDVLVNLSWLNPVSGFWVQFGSSNSVSPAYVLAHDWNSQGYLPSGDYKIEIVESVAPNSLITDTFFTLADPNPINVVTSAANPSTPISNDGSVNITTVSGGAGVYTYQWSPTGATTQNINNLGVGTYSCIITDSNGCTDTVSETLSAQSSCGLGSIISQNVSCYGAGDGVISISNVFGVSPYTISIRDTNANNSNLDTNFVSTLLNYSFVGGVGLAFDYTIGKGVYEYIFLDNSGCGDTVYISVERDGGEIQIGDTIISVVTDTSNPNGSFTLDLVTGGFPNGVNPPYNYAWYDANGWLLQSSASNTLSSIDTGAYSVIITDNNIGCSSTVIAGSVSLNITLQMTLAPACFKDSILTNNTCPLANNGQAIFILGGGWQGSQLYDTSSITIGMPNQDTIGGLYAGIYNLVLDPLPASSCGQDTIIFEILEPKIDSIHILNAVSGSSLCSGDSSRIFIQISDIDTISYEYAYLVSGYNPGNLVEDTSDVYFTSGNYDLVLQYQNNQGTFTSCGIVDNFTISEYDLSINSVNKTSVICGVSSAVLDISINGDNSPFIYYIHKYSDSTLVDSNITSNFNQSFNLWQEDTLLISVVDSLECGADWSVPVVIDEIVNIDIKTGVTTKKESCREDDGYLQVVPVNGQGDYDFELRDSLNVTLIATSIDTDTFTIDTLEAGRYILTVIDDSLCVQRDTITIEHVVEFEIASLTKTKETCCGYDGSIQVNINPGEGDTLLYTLTFDTSAVSVLGLTEWPSASYIDTFNVSQNDSLFTSLTRGYYDIFVEDEYGCVDSIDYVSFYQGVSSISTYLGIDTSMQLDMDYSNTDVVCYGDTNATIKLLYPNECYNYELWLYHDTSAAELIATDSIRVLDTLVYYNQLLSGIYGIQGMSNSGYSGCIRRSDTFEILEPTVVSYDSPLSTAAFCLNGGFAIDLGACNGTVWLPNNPSGGVTDTSIIQGDTLYQYYINRVNSSTSYFQGPILSDSVFSGLCPGEYEVQVFDGNNCYYYDTVLVADSSLYIDALITTDISCFDSSDATISVFAHGGVSPYYYEWTDSNGFVFSDTIAVVDSLAEGVYNVTVFDSTGCYAIGDASITSAPNELMLVSRRDEFDLEETCLGYTYDGRVGFEIRGGTSPYLFNWVDSAGNTGSFNSYAIYCDTCTTPYTPSGTLDSIYILDGLTTGIYNYTLTDINGCNDSTWFPIDSIQILAANRNNPLSIDSIMGWQDTLCYGGISDDIIFYMNDSVMLPLLFELDSGNAVLVSYNGIFSSLSAAEYDILITDSFGCFIEGKITIIEHSEVIISSVVDSVSCFGLEDGSISLQVSGGTPVYSYLWDNTISHPAGATTQDLNNLLEGTYGVTVTDTNGCTATDSIYIGEPSPLQSTVIEVIDASCFGASDGSASISVIGGTPSYSYVWDSNSSVTNSLSSVSSGIYLCIVTDANGCEDTISISLGEPTEVVLEVVSTDSNLCAGDANGKIIMSASGGVGPYTYYYDNGSWTSIGSNILSNLSFGFYDLVAKDDNGCSSSVMDSAKVGEPNLFELTIYEDIDLTCYESNDGSIKVILSGGVEPYDYQTLLNETPFENGVVFQENDTLELNYLTLGEYYFVVNDYNNCKDSIEVSISQPDLVTSDFTLSENLILKNDRVDVVNLSSGANVFIWNFGDGTPSVEAYETDHKYTKQGSFDMMLIANNSALLDACNDTFLVNIDVEGYDIYNVFTPNGDNVNDTYQFTDEMLMSLNVSIFNRWGQEVYGFNDVNGVWDGKGYNGELLPDGVYFFTMEAVGELGTSYVEEGTITLIR